MQAKVGDSLILDQRRPDQFAEIIEVRGGDGQPPYLVRFADGRESLVYPGPDAQLISSG